MVHTGVNPWVVLYFNKNLVKTLKEAWRTCRCFDRCQREQYINQIEELTSNCEDTRYSSQTDTDFINNSTLFMNKKRTNDMLNHQRQRSNSNCLTVPNSPFANNNNRKLIQKSIKNENLSVDYSPTRRRSSSTSDVNKLRPNSKPLQSPGIEMQTLYTPNDF